LELCDALDIYYDTRVVYDHILLADFAAGSFRHGHLFRLRYLLHGALGVMQVDSLVEVVPIQK
jgi:hypothetical protein